MFGRVRVLTGKVTVYALCEPPQESTETGVVLDEKFELEPVMKIASDLDLKCVGMALIQPKASLSAEMIKRAAQFQQEYGEYFTTLVLQTTTDTHAFQVNDSLVKIANEDLFDESDDPEDLTFKRDILVFGALTMRVKAEDLLALLVAVGCKLCKSRIPHHEFPGPDSRPREQHLATYLSNYPCRFQPYWYMLFDFNLLVFLLTSKILDLAEMSVLTGAIKVGGDVPIATMRKIENAASSQSRSKR
jgi:hypothetical protein